jgi:hypothetical protein
MPPQEEPNHGNVKTTSWDPPTTCGPILSPDEVPLRMDPAELIAEPASATGRQRVAGALLAAMDKHHTPVGAGRDVKFQKFSSSAGLSS